MAADGMTKGAVPRGRLFDCMAGHCELVHEHEQHTPAQRAHIACDDDCMIGNGAGHCKAMVAQCSVSWSVWPPRENWHFKAWFCRPAVVTTVALAMAAFPGTTAQCAASGAIGREIAPVGRNLQPRCLRIPSP